MPSFSLILILAVASCRYPNTSGKMMTTENFQKLYSASVLNSISIGENGPIKLADEQFLKKIAHFVRERRPERVPSPIGNGAFGFFECTNPTLSNISSASLFAHVGKRSDVVIRFGTPTARPGGTENRRAPVTFGIRFFTDEGNWDLLAFSSPIFFVREGIRFPDLTHSVNLDPANNLFTLNEVVDLINHNPELLSEIFYFFSDLFVPDGWRSIDGFSINTFKLKNDSGKMVYVRFKLETQQKRKFTTEEELINYGANIPDYQSRDLYSAILRGDYPQWIFKAQILDMDKADELDFNPFDTTRLWDERRFSSIILGKVVLNKNPTNWFSQIEQLALNPGHLVDGIEFGPDKLLQSRLQAYRDSHNYRLGPNHFQLGANAARVPAHQPTVTDGLCFSPVADQEAANFYPNSMSKSRDSMTKESNFYSHLEDTLIRRFQTGTDDYYSQPDWIWRSFTFDHQERVIQRLISYLARVDGQIGSRFIEHVRGANSQFHCRLVSAIMNGTSSCQ
ncbi:peroxisomal catalase 1-like [Brevipalpus obovatus]|uniref:peroxisomal catalase 1-like n=1 Tax=Brevipalpus obovatus TaxID=246614 RepID=UPI003D9E2280